MASWIQFYVHYDQEQIYRMQKSEAELRYMNAKVVKDYLVIAQHRRSNVPQDQLDYVNQNVAALKGEFELKEGMHTTARQLLLADATNFDHNATIDLYCAAEAHALAFLRRNCGVGREIRYRYGNDVDHLDRLDIREALESHQLPTNYDQGQIEKVVRQF